MGIFGVIGVALAGVVGYSLATAFGFWGLLITLPVAMLLGYAGAQLDFHFSR